MATLRLGTRKSALAQAQAKWVADRLRAAFPDVQIEFVLITTSGDLRTEERPATGEGGLKALFTKEIEEALLANKIDLAVHSLKDMAGELPKGLWIGAIPEREDPRDAWISRDGTPFKRLAAGARVGTGAVRRQAQLRHIRSDLALLPLRGNVDTRLRKLQEGELDGIILALAGLKRLGREGSVTEVLSTNVLLPAVGQGCLAVEVREGDPQLDPLLKTLDHVPSRLAATAERAFLQTLGGSCQTPIAAYAQIHRDQISFTGLVVSTDGHTRIQESDHGPARDADVIGRRLAKKLLVYGAGKLLH